MKRMTIFLLVLLTVIFLSHGQVFAEEVSLAEEFGINDIPSSLDYNAADFLSENGITPDSAEGVTSLSPKTVLSYMAAKLKSSACAPLRLLSVILSVVLLASAASAAADTVNGGVQKVCRIVSVLAAAAVIVPPIEECVEQAAVTLSDGGDFMLCYVPVFAGICTASGSVTAAAGYSAIMLMTAESAVKFVSGLIIPVISVCMAMTIVNSFSPAISLSGIAELLKKGITLLLGLIMTVFTGLLSLQSIVGTSADTVTVKAAKFMAANLIPIVGGAVADAYSAMRSGLGLLRGAAGAFGIIALTVTILPPVLNAVCMYLAMWAGRAAAELFGVKELAGLFKGAASVLSMVIAVLSCFCVMFVISTVIMMAAGLGGTV
ncbi:MAG: hypothetical protein ACI4Q6_10495 [Huintestinicola sp.]